MQERLGEGQGYKRVRVLTPEPDFAAAIQLYELDEQLLSRKSVRSGPRTLGADVTEALLTERLHARKTLEFPTRSMQALLSPDGESYAF